MTDGHAPTSDLDPRPFLRRPTLWLATFLALVALALGSYYLWYRAEGRYLESTEDAYVRADLVLITPRIEGTVADIETDDTQRVEAGQLLVRLDPLVHEIAARRAQAQYRLALAQIQEDKALLAQRQAELSREEAELVHAKTEADRRQLLFQKGMVSSEAMAAMSTSVATSLANVESARQAVRAQLEKLAGSPDLPAARQAVARIAAENLNMAHRSLDYTRIQAPVSGIVAKRAVQLGQHVTPGQALMAIVDIDRLWVEANFKETQLRHIRSGQQANVEVDTYPGQVFKARVIGVGAGTGSAFAVLPAENATGNWVKVVQRVPVRLAVEDADPARFPLAVGMSARVTVNTRADTLAQR